MTILNNFELAHSSSDIANLSFRLLFLELISSAMESVSNIPELGVNLKV